MTPSKWKLVDTQDVSPSKWFPVEKRTYLLPSGKVVDDFFVTTLADVAMIVPLTQEGKVVLVKQFKPGFDEVIIEFPAGRIEKSHKNIEETAIHELEEETGIAANEVEYFATLAGFVTKGTEKVSCFLARDVEFNSTQNLDTNEDIEVITLSPKELDLMIENNQIVAAITIAAWEVAKKKFPDISL